MPRMVEILLIEDSLQDTGLTFAALDADKVCNPIRVARDGEEALEYLLRQGRYRNATLPDLVLLDLSLPKIDGREVLARIKSSAELKKLPVVVMTASNVESDVLRGLGTPADCYLVKPIDWAQLAFAGRHCLGLGVGLTAWANKNQGLNADDSRFESAIR